MWSLRPLLVLASLGAQQWRFAAAQSAPCEHTPTSRHCWGEYDIDTDYYVTTPETGVTREYWLSAEHAVLSPDGYRRDVLTMNGTIPGPTIEADWGDEVVIHVTNNFSENGTAIHWHGIRQLLTSASDGVPGTTQCPTPPLGATTTYRFRATQYGSSWYHSHYSLQLADGILGAIVIHGPATADYDVDAGPVVLMDWFHESAFKIWEVLQRQVALIQPAAANGLINGVNAFDCSKSNDPACEGSTARWEPTQFEKGKKYRFRVVGAQTDGWFKFAIDGHRLTVIAADFVPVEPYETDAVLLASGQRYDVVVEAADPDGTGLYWLRGIYQTACNFNNNFSKDNILGIVRYADAATGDAEPSSVKNENITNSCGDEDYDKLVPRVAHDVGASAYEQTLGLQWFYELDLVFHWTLHGKSLIVNWSDPTLLEALEHPEQAAKGIIEYPVDSNVFVVEEKDVWVYWVIQDLAVVNAFHPMHLHGHDFYVLAQGRGLFVPELVELNTKNPPRRDTATLYGTGYTVIAFKTDNPGAWLMHCHIAWHASQGLALQLIERPADMAQTAGAHSVTLDEMEETCATWTEYYETAEHKQDDSGI